MRRVGEGRIKRLLETYLEHNRHGFEENIKDEYPVIYKLRQPVTKLTEGLVKWLK